MDRLIIRGGVPLRGKVEAGGAKNAALPALVASLLTEESIRLHRVPQLGDVKTIIGLLDHLGVSVERGDRDTLSLRADGIGQCEAPYHLVKTMRASVLVLGPLAARFGRARVSLPGGCAIGPRPINLHLAALEKMGATISLDGGYVEAKAPRLRGARITFDGQTVTGTENVMMAATLADGVTVLENAACEPEVADLAALLNRMGARIEGAGTPTISIEGVQHLHGAEHEVIPDRVETGTFMVAAAMTGGDVTINRCLPGHLEAITEKLRETGVFVEETDSSIRVWGDGQVQGVNIRTHPYPGFATDMQAQFMALLSIAQGSSVITETVFENRFMHVNELLRMGADIKVIGTTAFVHGVPMLSGAPVMATDLRASASLVLAGLAAKGTTTVSRVYHLDRGYESIERKLQSLGAGIERVTE
ncbi:UDP-N-acetylglucosamine 1-carboxyvinyltransferase [Candidatus Methylomirabilis lanthanidiphila]|uniref:UDP-N-acetylglucosamine 1-carboxyvinyltransferase n=1 Tax=Candidatus Methylomirabilis lanthanidiphila TaxID=2211376 RepID=A0A564ZFM9_9BACT|nr:UDP-N-acetylglucosamine 1-carboxyvinyltransferase [Candidatus Methylomirabilis lanthanidiphila]VUZ84120.1 UDP-N-acetylglucosamine 1-carboxyvinyltransferase [Candidatus Methylomirabilis lanthanidiphila]